jgi:hypothetical protein
MPYVNARWIVPVITIAAFILIFTYVPGSIYHGDGRHLNIPVITFYIVWIVIAALSFLKNYSLIPVLGLLSCFYLLTGMGTTNWIMFFIWLMIGLIIYFLYGYRHSRLARK